MTSSVRSKLIGLALGFQLLPLAAHAIDEVQLPPRTVPVLPWRKNRVGAEFLRSFGTPAAEKKQGFGAGVSFLFPLTDSGFDLGVRYSVINQAVNQFTILTFVFDYFVFPSYVRGVYFGGEVGVTDSNAETIFSVYNDYVFVGKLGYEYWFKGTKWSVAGEFRRMAKTEDPIKMNRESHLYSDQILLSARYEFGK